MKIDVFTHVLPPEYHRRLKEQLATLEDPILGRFFGASLAIDPGLWDLETRLREMDEVGPDYRQVLTLPAPGLEDIAEPALGAELARIANDEMADMVVAHPDRFAGFVAQVPMNGIDAAVVELEHAINERGALGVQLGSNILGRSIDHPEFAPIIDTIAALDRAIWLHPARSIKTPDYAGEPLSRHFLFFALGWPYETALALARLVFSGTMDRHPALKVIAHHGGGMLPYFYKRLAALAGSPMAEGPALSHPPLEYFHRFFVDTVLDDIRPALQAVVAFFGADHVLYGTDYGFRHDPRVEAATIDSLDLPADDRDLIFAGNALRILPIQREQPSGPGAVARSA